MNKSERLVKILKALSKEQGETMLGNMSKSYTPFEILIATILSARSKDETTYPISRTLFKKYKDSKALANAKTKDVEKIIKKIGFYRQKSKYIIETARIIDCEYKGKVPKSMEKLTALPGVGRKVAGCVMVYAFDLDAIPVDVHVNRLSNRLGIVKTKQPEETEQKLMQITPLKYWRLVNDLLVWHGKNCCKPITPECYRCKIARYCKYKNKTKN